MASDTGVYLIENLVNGHRYVGSAISFKKRWREHIQQLSERHHHNRYLQRAWDRYGKSSFTFRPIIFCDRENLIVYEQAAMDGLKPEYNIAPVAGSQLGYRHGDETRAKLRDARARNKFGPRRGVRLSDDTKARISLGKKGAKFGPYSEQRKAKAAAATRAATAKISESVVIEMRRLMANGVSKAEIARIVGCTNHVAYDVLSGRSWGWVK